MLQGEHSAILSTYNKLPFVIKIFVLSIFEWSLKTGFSVIQKAADKDSHSSIKVLGTQQLVVPDDWIACDQG